MQDYDAKIQDFLNIFDLNSVGYIPRSLLRFVKTASERVLLSEAEPRSVRGVAK
jgi:Ca2+-binding EF-hand superfamily protein